MASPFMLNVSSETPGVGAGVLIRAIEPTDGIAIIARNRDAAIPRETWRAALDGYARPCGLIGGSTGIDFCQPGPLWLGRVDGQASGEIGQSRANGSA